MSENITPMMRQYNEIKKNYPDAILFFRLGDFYEMFSDDARVGASILNLALTKRAKTPMCGIPYHASKTYIKKLLAAGKKVAVCEQLTQPGMQKGIVKRDVIEVLTPGTVIEDNYISSNENNYIIAIGQIGDFLSASYIDLSTGEFFVYKNNCDEKIDVIRNLFFRLSPKEVLIQEKLLDDNKISNYFNSLDSVLVNKVKDWDFDLELSFKVLIEKFETLNLRAFYIEKNDEVLYTCSALLSYVENNLKNLLPHISKIEVKKDNNFLTLDEAAVRNLELIRNNSDNSKKYTLLDTIDFTKTAMGFRRLKNYLLNPLLSVNEIKKRQEQVKLLFDSSVALNSIRDFMSEINDIQRLSVRLLMDRANAKDLIMLNNSLDAFFNIQNFLEENKLSKIIFKYDVALNELRYILELIEKSITEEPSIILTDGNLIKNGYSKELDRLKNINQNGMDVLEKYIEKERETTSINNLKVKFNNIIGYFIEVSKGNLEKVPTHFIRKQSLVNGERYTTNELLELEAELNSAKSNATNLEREIFIQVRDEIKKLSPSINLFVDYISSLDAFCSLAYCAVVRGYVMPEIDESSTISFINSRHPVVEANIEAHTFVPNSIKLCNEELSFALITGPNMAGKSTFLRQVALNMILAQMGSFIPADSAKLGIVDKIFCRVGASDNLTRGESTFLVEMVETANILRNATYKSLVIMDEVGRGTGTKDGLSIAQAIVENLLARNIKTIFATHYHELTLLKNEHIKNYSLKVLEENNNIIFLKKLIEGAATNSYGIYVAKLAGLPNVVLTRASEILNIYSKEEKKNLPELKTQENKLFSTEEIIINELRNVDVMNMTPSALLSTIDKWQKELR